MPKIAVGNASAHIGFLNVNLVSVWCRMDVAAVKYVPNSLVNFALRKTCVTPTKDFFANLGQE